MPLSTRPFARSACLLGATALSALLALPALAASSAASSASDSVATSVGSVSGSIENSSNSSSKATGVAEGDYKVIDVAALPEQPGTLRLKLQALAPDSQTAEFALLLPQDVVDRSRIAPGAVITARQRPYGLEFAKAQAATQGAERQAFYLVLSDEWYRELQTRPVVL